MTTVPPPTNPALPQLLAVALAPNGTLGATISNPPAPIAALAPGATLTGTVTAGPDPRILVLSTSSADVPLRTVVPLPEGAELTVEVTRNAQAQTTVRLVALDGQPLQQALAQAAKQATPQAPAPMPLSVQVALPTAPGTPVPLPAGQAWWPSGLQPLTELPQLSAYVIAVNETAEAATPTPGAKPQVLFAPGTEFGVRVTSLVLSSVNAATPTAQAPAQTPTTPSPANVAPPTVPGVVATPAPASTPQVVVAPTPSSPTTPVMLQPATRLALAAAPTPPPSPVPATPGPAPITTPATALATPGSVAVPLPPENQALVLPNKSGWSQPAPTPPANVTPMVPLTVITGTVVTSPEGVPVVQTPDGQIQLNVRANLPPGTVVTLEVTAQRPPSPLMAPPEPLPPANLPLAGPATGWPTLTEAIVQLQRSDPALAAQFANADPDGGTRSALAMMSLVQALRSGEPRQWPGDGNLRTLERIGPRGAQLASQLAGEVTELSRQVRDTGAEWRALPIPWQADGRVERIRLVVREDAGDDEATRKRKRGGGTRFLLDLVLSRLGPLQLEGMFKKDARTFDMMIRTMAALPEQMRIELAGLFATTNAAMNLVGALTFQVVKTFPDPLAGAAGGAEKSGLWG
jgi:hypothetical protein